MRSFMLSFALLLGWSLEAAAQETPTQPADPVPPADPEPGDPVESGAPPTPTPAPAPPPAVAPPAPVVESAPVAPTTPPAEQTATTGGRATGFALEVRDETADTILAEDDFILPSSDVGSSWDTRAWR